jgi:hypothetical protein
MSSYSFDLALGIQALTAQVAGVVLLPEDAAYESEAAMWNLSLSHRPLLVVAATSDLDIAAAVRFAASFHLPVAVAATGHGAVVPADGAVLINTSRITNVQVDESSRSVWIGAGAQWQKVVDVTARFGLAPVAGSSPTVGAVAYTLGGGLSPTLGRTYGYAADHVRAVELVTSDGRLRYVNAQTEPELFWGLRGGKGNFGVVTAMECGLFPVTRLYGGGLYFDGEHAPAVLDAFRELVQVAPDELTVSVALLRLPPAPFIPEPLRGRFVAHVRIAFLGTAEDGVKLITGLRAVAEPILDTVADMRFTDFAAIHADPVDPLPVNDRGILLRELPAAATEVILRMAGPGIEFPVTMVEIRHLGGALGRPPVEPNSTGNRDAQFSVFTAAVTDPEHTPAIAAAQAALLEALDPWSTGTRYLNFLGEQDVTPELVSTAFDPATYQRLAELKRETDPTNMFRINHNIPPAA